MMNEVSSSRIEIEYDTLTKWKQFLTTAKKTMTPAYFQALIELVFAQADTEKIARLPEIDPSIKRHLMSYLNKEGIFQNDILHSQYQDYARQAIFVDSFTKAPTLNSDWLLPTESPHLRRMIYRP